MINTMIPMTAQIPSGSALPTSASTTAALAGTRGDAAFGTAPAAAVCTAPTYVVRDRHVAGDVIAQGMFPGSTAWSPPIS